MRTTVNIDDAEFERARAALGTRGVTETVNAALSSAARRHRLADFDVRSFDVTAGDVEAGRKDELAAAPSQP